MCTRSIIAFLALVIAPALFGQTTFNCHTPGKRNLLWVSPTGVPTCIVIGPTLQWSTVNGHAQLDVVPPAVQSPMTIAVAWRDPTSLTVGAGCTITTPCNVSQQEATAQFARPGLITITAGDGIIRIFVDGSISPPVIRAYTSGTIVVACTFVSCAANPGSSFPTDSRPLWSWTASGGSWDARGGIDYRPGLNILRIIPGPGISIVELNGNYVISAASTQ